MSVISRKGNYIKSRRMQKKNGIAVYWWVLLVLLVVIFGIAAAIIAQRIEMLNRDKKNFGELSTLVSTYNDPSNEPENTLQIESSCETTTAEMQSEEPQTIATTSLPDPTEPQILPQYEEMAKRNSDVVGWIKIPETKIDFPVMHTPDEPVKYLHKDFDGNYSYNGIPFMDANCDIDSDQILVHGHNMNNGQMFYELLNYAEKDFWKEHPVIQFDTLYEKREYEIIAAFYDRVHYQYEDVFRYYYFADGTQEEFEEAVNYYKENSCYDTGLTASYGDQLIALSTCSYHTEDGRFVVVGRLIDSDEG